MPKKALVHFDIDKTTAIVKTSTIKPQSDLTVDAKVEVKWNKEWLRATILATSNDETALSEIDLELRNAAKQISTDADTDADPVPDERIDNSVSTVTNTPPTTEKSQTRGRKRTATKEKKKLIPKKQATCIKWGDGWFEDAGCIITTTETSVTSSSPGLAPSTQETSNTASSQVTSSHTPPVTHKPELTPVLPALTFSSSVVNSSLQTTTVTFHEKSQQTSPNAATTHSEPTPYTLTSSVPASSSTSHCACSAEIKEMLMELNAAVKRIESRLDAQDTAGVRQSSPRVSVQTSPFPLLTSPVIVSPMQTSYTLPGMTSPLNSLPSPIPVISPPIRFSPRPFPSYTTPNIPNFMPVIPAADNIQRSAFRPYVPHGYTSPKQAFSMPPRYMEPASSNTPPYQEPSSSYPPRQHLPTVFMQYGCIKQTPQDVTREEMEKIRMNSSSAKHFAVNMVRRMFAENELIGRNVRGVKNKEALDPHRIAQIRPAVMQMFGCPPLMQDDCWRSCIKSIDEVCRRATQRIAKTMG